MRINRKKCVEGPPALHVRWPQNRRGNAIDAVEPALFLVDEIVFRQEDVRLLELGSMLEGLGKDAGTPAVDSTLALLCTSLTRQSKRRDCLTGLTR